jgi:prepilin signal peptidase PulO-like enzyme (type II secretory pathway)
VGRLRFIAGAFTIVLGFLVYEYGFFLLFFESQLQSLSDWTMSLIGLASVDVRFLGAVLQLTGGAIAIAGLLICISWIGSQSAARIIEMSPERTAESVTQVQDTRPRCKFCGAAMEHGAAFCPSCQRAQA